MASTKSMAILSLETLCLSLALTVTNLLARTVGIVMQMENGMEFSLFVKVYNFLMHYHKPSQRGICRLYVYIDAVICRLTVCGRFEAN